MGLSRLVSNHTLLLLEDRSINWGPNPFRYLDMWFIHASFVKKVKEERRNLHHIEIVENFKKLKDPLRVWNRENIGSIDQKIITLELELQSIDC